MKLDESARSGPEFQEFLDPRVDPQTGILRNLIGAARAGVRPNGTHVVYQAQAHLKHCGTRVRCER